MRIAVVGPTHPYKGGVAQHTTALANRLGETGHRVQLVSWCSQYPHRLYPGVQEVVGEPEVPVVVGTRRRLHWARPWTWFTEGRRLRDVDLVVLAHVTPFQVPAYSVLLRAGSARDRQVAIVCHNVLPHEPSPLERPLVASLLRLADRVVTHSPDQAALARQMTGASTLAIPLPPHGPQAHIQRQALPPIVHRRLLFFGLVRPYKGLDLLLRALAAGPPDVSLRVAGEFWGGVGSYEQLCRELGIRDRVELLEGYVAAEDVAGLFADVDAVVLPYRTATGSQAPLTAFNFGLPVITTDAGALAEAVTPDVDGLVVPANDVAGLAAAITEFFSDERSLQLRAGVRQADPAAMWSAYLDAVGAY